MRPRIIIASLTLALAGALAVPARAEDGYRHGRLRLVEPGVTLERASGVGAEEADTNEPFLPGDRVWTDAVGRAEFQFPDGSLVRLDRRSKLDYSGHEEEDGERIVLRLWSGSLYLRVRTRDARFEVETPAGTVRGLERSLVRIDVDAGEARVSVFEGEALLDDGQDSVRLAAGERTYARSAGRADEPQRFDLDDEGDDFALWNADQDQQDRWDGRSARYLPDELDAYSGEFDTYGDWSYETSVGYVWVPRVAVDWQPYWQGRWCWTPYGWTWVPYERWGWAPAHYGRWGHGSRGWYWIPGRTWGPAWVSWAVGGGYVGWCPLGWRDRPVRDWDPHFGRERGHAVPRGFAQIQPWNVVRQTELGGRDLARRRVSVERADLTALQVAASPRLRPTRDAMRLREGEAVPRAIRTRPTPGDFVRELAVDNKTTIPAPWFRRGGARERDASQARDSRANPAGDAGRSTTRRTGEPAAGRTPWFTPQGGSGEARERSRSTTSPWSVSGQSRAREAAPFTPPARAEVERPRRDAQPAPERVWGGGESQRSRGDERSASRQRETSGGPARPSREPAARPRGNESRPSGGEARSSGAGAPRPSGAETRSSGGRSQSGAERRRR